MTRPHTDPAASMTLLREVLDRPLDPGYAAAARRRDTARPLPWWRRMTVLLLAAVLGLGTVWAARELRVPTPGASAARVLLVEQIEDGTSRAERTAARNEEVVGRIHALEAQSLTGASSAYLDHVRMLGVNAGSVRVAGPGIVITLDDSRDAQEGEPGAELGLVQDLDLQILVNALWGAGAEAIAINGHRLTSVSAIRSAGRAILVDLAPLARPYVVEAVGPAQDLQARLARATGGEHLATLSDVFGISVSMSSADELELPGSSLRTLRYAEPLAELPSVEGEL
ncbi:DUF881 domain-containing protein [Georgenia sp. MJ170]|uniref:DUF881 domain-containing protein n=1 Tax=Georgenia sunbinii TaxID=3117728 RepID=UPI002F26DDE1